MVEEMVQVIWELELEQQLHHQDQDQVHRDGVGRGFKCARLGFGPAPL